MNRFIKYDADRIYNDWSMRMILKMLFYFHAIVNISRDLGEHALIYDHLRALVSSHFAFSTELIWSFAATALWAKAVLHKFRSRLDSNLYCAPGLMQDSHYIARALNHQKL